VNPKRLAVARWSLVAVRLVQVRRCNGMLFLLACLQCGSARRG
jgi:hypothetical protein